MKRLSTKIPDVRVSEALLAEIRLAGELECLTASEVIRRVLVDEFARRAFERQSGQQEAA
jgi:hypothetical protein